MEPTQVYVDDGEMDDHLSCPSVFVFLLRSKARISEDQSSRQ